MCPVCSVQGCYEQNCHIAMYQREDLAMLFGINMPQQANANVHIILVVKQLATEQRRPQISMASKIFSTGVPQCQYHSKGRYKPARHTTKSTRWVSNQTWE